MNKIKYFLIFALLPFFAQAQNIVSIGELFENKLHPSVAAKADESNGYKILSLIRLKVPNAPELIKEFEQNNPNSYLITQMYFYQAVNLFDNADYQGAGEMFDKINNRDLYKEQQDELNFRKGYSYMRLGKHDEALRFFERTISNNKSQFVYPALYYCGYIHYINRSFNKAIPYFERSQKDSRYGLLSKYHILESKFLLKDYYFVINNGAEVYDAIDNEYKSKVARIMSEAYYSLNKPEEAKYYFELYSLTGGNMSKNDLFYAGMIHYSLNNYISATDAFSQIASERDSIGQSAAYHLGQSYIQLKNKHKAREAFATASSCDFDPAVKEDALFNYAKLTFDLNRDVNPFNEYLDRYKSTTSKSDEIHSYIATSFLINGNYQEAIEALGAITNPDANTILNIQKASFFRGMQLFKTGSYSKAVENFKNSIEHGSYNLSLKNLAMFWLAECYYRKDLFGNSLDLLQQLQKVQQFRTSAEYPLSQFNIAYNLFKMEQYESAISAFEKYTTMGGRNENLAMESRVRIADSYYMLRDYPKASELYEKVAIEANFNDLYPVLQGALCYGLIGKNEKKCALLQESIKPSNKRSPLYSQALYELGRSYILSVEDEKAEPIFKQLTTMRTDSSYYYMALLELGMIKANKKEYESALGYYKTIIAEKPVSEEAQSALAGIENIYQSQNKPEIFLAYLDTIGLSKIKSPDERESMLFNAAEQIYLSNNYKEALDALTSFTEKYPNGTKTPHAFFYMAESYSNLKRPEKAADYYYRVMETGDGLFSELATLRYGEISYSLEHYKEAIMAYETLSKIAIIDNNKIEAVVGKMRAYYGNKEYSTSLSNAMTLLKMTNISSGQLKEGKYYAAKNHLALGEREEALAFLKEVAADPSSEEGSEAAYLLILDAYDAGNFDEVEEMAFALSESGKAKQYWLAKSFIVLGDSYAERDNLAQAEATFKSIIDNYKSPDGDDIMSIVKIRMNKLSNLKQEVNNESK